jgi:hypothetical protein
MIDTDCNLSTMQTQVNMVQSHNNTIVSAEHNCNKKQHTFITTLISTYTRINIASQFYILYIN